MADLSVSCGGSFGNTVERDKGVVILWKRDCIGDCNTVEKDKGVVILWKRDCITGNTVEKDKGVPTLATCVTSRSCGGSFGC